MKPILFLALIFGFNNAFAKKHKTHRHHEAHVHGAASLNIAFDHMQGKLEFKAASMGLLGFEHEAKTEKDKKILSEAISNFENNISKLVKFEDALGCTFSKEKIEMTAAADKPSKKSKHKHEHMAEHSDFIAHFTIQCQKEVKGSKIQFDFSSYSDLKDLDVTILIGELQKTLELKGKPASIDLK